MAPKISIEIAATIPTGDYANIRPMVRVEDIDIELPIEPQIEDSVRVIRQVYQRLDDELELLCADTVSGLSGKPTVRETVEKLTKNLLGIVEVLREKGIIDDSGGKRPGSPRAK